MQFNEWNPLPYMRTCWLITIRMEDEFYVLSQRRSFVYGYLL